MLIFFLNLLIRNVQMIVTAHKISKTKKGEKKTHTPTKFALLLSNRSFPLAFNSVLNDPEARKQRLRVTAPFTGICRLTNQKTEPASFAGCAGEGNAQTMATGALSGRREVVTCCTCCARPPINEWMMPVFRLGDLEDRRTRQVQRLKNIGPKLQFSHKSNTTGLFYSNAATWWRDKHSYGNTHPAPHSHVVRKKTERTSLISVR